jgi:nicotinamidase-related amidase
MPTTIDRDRTAVLIMDYQNDILTRFTQIDEATLTRAADVLRAARAAGLPVIYVKIAFRPGYPEVPEQGLFAMVRGSGMLVDGTEGANIHPAVAPQSGDTVVLKKRVGAATGSDLEQVLSAKRRTHLVMFGVATSGVVLSTVRWAADHDYTMNVVSDCCVDRDPEVHRVLLEKVFAQMAPAITASDFVSAVQ